MWSKLPSLNRAPGKNISKREEGRKMGGKEKKGKNDTIKQDK